MTQGTITQTTLIIIFARIMLSILYKANEQIINQTEKVKLTKIRLRAQFHEKLTLEVKKSSWKRAIASLAFIQNRKG